MAEPYATKDELIRVLEVLNKQAEQIAKILELIDMISRGLLRS